MSIPDQPVSRNRRLEIEVAATVDATSFARSAVAGGIAVRGRFGGNSLAVVVGAGFLSPTTLDFGIGRARLQRWPFDVALRAAFTREKAEFSFDLGAALTLTSLAGEALPQNARETRLEFGVGARVGVFYWRSDRVAPFAAIGANWVPSPTELTVAPIGVVGRTEALRWSAQLGFSVRID